MNRFFLLLASIALFVPTLTHAATSAQLIKGPDSTAVYYAIDERRFSFPNEAIFRSWYQDFSQVTSVSRETLASYRLSGNVVYKPGELIKVTSDPKVYAVDHLAHLHWIKTEAIARSLYGDQWATQIHDLDNGFFADYTIAEPVEQASDWNPMQARQNALSIASNQELSVEPPLPTTPTSTTPAPTSTTPVVIPNRLVISVAPSPVRLGDTVTVQAFAVGSVALQQIRLNMNGIATTCFTTPCVYRYTVPVYSAPSQLAIHGEAIFIDQTTQTANGSIAVTGQAQGALRLVGNTNEVKRGDAIEWVATWNETNTIPARIAIVIDENEIKTCFNTRECRYNEAELNAVDSVHTVYAKAYESGGQEWTTPSDSYRVVINPHPTLQFSIDKDTVYTGEITTISAQASDDTNIARLDIFANDQLVKSCSSPTCTAPVGPWSNESFIILKAVAEDRSGLTTEKALRVLVLPAPTR